MSSPPAPAQTVPSGEAQDLTVFVQTLLEQMVYASYAPFPSRCNLYSIAKSVFSDVGGNHWTKYPFMLTISFHLLQFSHLTVSLTQTFF